MVISKLKQTAITHSFESSLGHQIKLMLLKYPEDLGLHVNEWGAQHKPLYCSLVHTWKTPGFRPWAKLSSCLKEKKIIPKPIKKKGDLWKPGYTRFHGKCQNRFCFCPEESSAFVQIDANAEKFSLFSWLYSRFTEV